MKPRAHTRPCAPLLLAAVLLTALLLATTTATATATTEPDPHDLRLREAAGPFDVTLEACTFVEERLECRLKVHNQLASAVRLRIDDVLLYDNDGSIHRPFEVRVGGASDRRPKGTRQPDVLVPGGTKVQVEIAFTSVSRRKQKASKLVVGVADQPRLEIGPFPFARR